MNSQFTTAQAGTLESNDIMVTIAPYPANEIKVDIDSIVMAQYGDVIRQTITAVIAAQGVSGVYVKAVDRGALDCTIRARMLTALCRAGVTLKEGWL